VSLLRVAEVGTGLEASPTSGPTDDKARIRRISSLQPRRRSRPSCGARLPRTCMRQAKPEVAKTSETALMLNRLLEWI
jgi:hypothetical protein